MKSSFTSLDIACVVKELKGIIGMRVNQVYDIDQKTYLIKFQASQKKSVLLIESGCRIHLTSFDWPKNDHPNGFSMKLRKHLGNKRIERIQQMSQDRIIDLEFGSGDAAHHIFIELYDKGNIILTDYQLIILNVLRPHIESTYKLLVKETFPLERIKKNCVSNNSLKEVLEAAKEGDFLKKLLIPFIDYGPSNADHVLNMAGFKKSDKVKETLNSEEIERIINCTNAVMTCIKKLINEPSKGYIIKKKESRASGEVIYTNIEFQPHLFQNFSEDEFDEYNDFNTTVDEFFSKLESQKIDMKALREEKAALKKVEKIKLDQASRLKDLDKKQLVDAMKAELIMCNIDKVEAAITAIRAFLAAQMSWEEISERVADAHIQNDPVGSIIKKLKLETNSVTLHLHNTDEECENSSALVDVHLELSAYGNVKKYYDEKKFASNKQQKTLQAQGKALKTAEKKVETVLRDIKASVTITKSRTVFWFEKFLWFITSENYIVIGSRDKYQIDLIIRRYMSKGDIFVHSDIPGASCFVIKNPIGNSVPPKTLNEAGTMAVCFSSAWDVHIIANAWWVTAEQVIFSSNIGTTYTIKDTKNYLLPAQLAIGFGFIFYIDTSGIERHANERQVKYKEIDNQKDEESSEIEDSKEMITIDEKCECFKTIDSSVSDESDQEQFFSNERELEESKTEVESSSESDSDSEHSLQDTKLPSDEKDENNSQPEEVTKLEALNLDEIDDLKGRKKVNRKKLGNEKKSIDKIEKKNVCEANAFKRGQRSKLKKIKEKYKDQDEEDKMLRMAILQSAGTKKESKKKNKHVKHVHQVQEKEKKIIPQKPHDDANCKSHIDETDVPIVMNISMLNQLTGIPHPEDKIIFAMPVVAPYNTLVPYKYRVKMIPGTSKRGKSARQALNIFLNNKESSEQEKVVMRNVNDQILCRDLPGKIKLSIGQQAAKLKKKK